MESNFSLANKALCSRVVLIWSGFNSRFLLYPYKFKDWDSSYRICSPLEAFSFNPIAHGMAKTQWSARGLIIATF